MTSVQQVNKSNEEEIKEFHLKKLADYSEPEPEELDFKVDGSVWRNGKLIAERLTEEQEEWVEGRMRGPSRTWQRWFVGQYFTEQQKKELELTDEDIAGRGMA